MKVGNFSHFTRSLGTKGRDLPDLRWAVLLHDIGRLGVSNMILDKNGALTESELTARRRHPEYTVEILQRVEPFRPIADMAGSHGCTRYPIALARSRRAIPVETAHMARDRRDSRDACPSLNGRHLFRR